MENGKHGKKLLRWYDANARVLPWRVGPQSSVHPDPYHVWLSEIMLQQTVVKTVIPYFETFLSLWPTVFELAACDQEDVLRRWAGLGYYARARNLHACAQFVVKDFGGRFPQGDKDLLALPGIGPYTASAIRAIAFDQRAVVVDGNVERVVARLYALKQPLGDIKSLLKQKAGELTPSKRPGDYAQAMMDLGATLCTPKSPDCRSCPLREGCAARAEGCAASLPIRAKKKPKPVRCGAAYLAVRDDGAILLRQRPDKGLLAKMLEVPATPWCKKEAGDGTMGHEEAFVPLKANWHPLVGFVAHTFSHFHLRLEVKLARVERTAELLPQANIKHCRWVARDRLAGEALPSVMRKIIEHALALEPEVFNSADD